MLSMRLPLMMITWLWRGVSDLPSRSVPARMTVSGAGADFSCAKSYATKSDDGNSRFHQGSLGGGLYDEREERGNCGGSGRELGAVFALRSAAAKHLGRPVFRRA